MVGDRLEADVARRACLLVLDHGGVRQVVGKRLQPLMEQRQPVLDPGGAAARRHGLVNRVVGRHRAEGRAVAFAEARDALPGQHDLACRHEIEALQPVGAPLVHGVETADVLDLVPEQVDSKRGGPAGWKEVDQPAPDGVFAGLHHGFGALVAMPLQKGEQRFRVHKAAGLAGEPAARKAGPRRHALEEGVCGGQQDVGPRPVGQRRQGREALGHEVVARRAAVIGQAVPAREPQQRKPRREEAEALRHPRHLRIVARDVDDRPPALRQRRQHARIVARRRASQADPSGTVERRNHPNEH